MALVSERLAFLISADGAQAIRAFEDTGRAAERELGKAEAKIDRVGGSLTRFGAGALAASGIAAGGLFTLAESAAEFSASVAANEQVLGESSRAIQEWAEDSVEAAGLSEQAAIDATTSFGSLAKTAGLTGQEVAGFSTDLVELAADLAAFKDVSPEQVLQDLQSGFAGSTEVLRKYNIFLDDASLKAAVFRETGEEVTGTLTTQQKIIAINSELYRQSADAQGQWARESDGLIAQQAQLKAELENLQATIGAGVLPVVNELVGTLTNAAAAFNSLDPAVQSGVGTFATYATGVAGVGGALSLASGQAIKFRNTLVTTNADGVRSLTRLGRAGRLLGPLAAAFIGFEVASATLNELSGRSRIVEEDLRSLMATLRDDTPDATAAVEEFVSLADEIDKFGGGGFLGFMDTLFTSTVEIDGTRASLDQYRKALERVFEQDPEAAVELLDTFIAQRDAARTAGEDVSGYNEVLGELGPLMAELSESIGTTTDELRDGGDEMSKAAGDADKLTASVEDVSEAVNQLERDLNGLRSEISGERAVIQLTEDFQKLEEATIAANEAAVEGSVEAEEAARDQREALLDLKDGVIDFAEELTLLPAEKVTEILAEIDEGNLAEAERRLDEAAKDRTLFITAVLRGTNVGFNPSSESFTPSAGFDGGPRMDGGQVRAGDWHLVGENGPEWWRAPGTGMVYPNGSPFGPGNDDAVLAELRAMNAQLAAGAASTTVNVRSQFVDSRALGQAVTESADRRAALNGTRFLAASARGAG